MQIIRGTTPTITANVRSSIDLSQVEDIWVYIYQQGSVVINKGISNVDIDTDLKTIKISLSQEETLSLKADTAAIFQIRLLLSGGIALATLAANVAIKEIYKDGVIGGASL